MSDYIVWGKVLHLCEECKVKNPELDNLAFSINFHKELIWHKIRIERVLILSSTHKNKNMTELLIRNLTEEGLITNGYKREGPIRTKIVDKKGIEREYEIYKYKIRISASLV